MRCPICKEGFFFVSHLRTHELNQLATALWFELRKDMELGIQNSIDTEIDTGHRFDTD